MRFILLILFGAMVTSASAQWYRIDLKLKKKLAPPAPVSERLFIYSISRFPVEKITQPKIYPVVFDRTEYNIEATEAVIMKTAQHNMRFRIYNDASYNFTELAHLFIQQNRYSEAIWYLLQSNTISRQQNDDEHTISNLIDLATIKASMGETALAEQDLTEAHDLAYSKGLTDDLETIDLAMHYITQNKLPKQKPVLIYADDAKNNGKANNKSPVN